MSTTKSISIKTTMLKAFSKASRYFHVGFRLGSQPQGFAKSQIEYINRPVTRKYFEWRFGD
jgi:hypothetical protein